MSQQTQAPIIIIGSGFAAYQLIKAIRRSDLTTAIQVFSCDSGDDYNKPDLSHVASKKQLASDLIRATGAAMATEFDFELWANTRVDAIEPDCHRILVADQAYPYSKLVLATGAKAFIPPMSGNAIDRVMTLNSLQEYQAVEQQLALAKRILVIGGGLIGAELSMDLASAGKKVMTVDPCDRLMANLLPEYIALQLGKKMQGLGVELALNDSVVALNHTSDSTSGSSSILAKLASNRQTEVDMVISAAGLMPNIALAQRAGIAVGRGIIVDGFLQTSAADIFALGDCAEIDGKVLAYLQPALLSANALAKTLLGQATKLELPAMLVKIKTPHYPIQLGGNTVVGIQRWQMEIDAEGCSVNALNAEGTLQGFVVAEQHMNRAFSLLKSL
ncbi:NADH:flavorubredoxin reductase NorW [Shewanella sp. Isolate13]|uniref:NADH:flavorubredoxin reductase NorW n=1 Tax=Shewanella sp. Isolate13 TaxID=2908531 RepID=UPI001EFC6A29|nr:NADH:flavorubredoxin reductase NorW [Shewanella sp. Isolate13]MCG9728488.1 NADH:flavorubredoxin reductase NorW [Shewanella sp. Isolate13]